MAESEEDREPRPDSNPAGRRRYWLPVSLRLPYLSFLVGFFILLALSIEALRQYSNRHNGLVHLKSYEELGRFTSGVYTYVPTAFAILAVALWNIPALDVLRLEPFFQLAKPEGAPGDILFTNYCFFYGIMAPVAALRNRHWVVACVSTTSIALRVMLPTLLSGIVGLDEPNIVSTRHVDTWPHLLDLQTQDSFFANAAYRHGNESSIYANTFFSYQVPDYSMPPVSTPIHSRSPGSSTWLLDQDVYWSDLRCLEAPSSNIFPEIQSSLDDDMQLLQWSMRNLSIQSSLKHNASSSCDLSVSLNSTYPDSQGSPQLLYWEPLGPHGNSSSIFNWNGDGCRSFSLFGLSIDIDTKSSNLSSKATAFGCTSTYFCSKADITLPSNTSIAEAANISSPATALTSADLSIARLQHMLYMKFSSSPADLRLQSNGDSTTPLLVMDSNSVLSKPQSTRTSIANYEQAIGQVWNQQFVATMDGLFNTTAEPSKIQAKHSKYTIIYSVSARPALLSEALLLAASLILLVLLFFYPRRPSFLLSDPGSIAAQCAIVTDMFPSTSHITDSGVDYQHATPRQLRHFSRSLWCKLVDGPAGNCIEIAPRLGYSTELKPQKPRRMQLNTRPHFLTPPWFLIECILMAGVLAAFGISFQFIRLDKFDTSDSAGVTILWLFLDYGPTVIASMISSLFVSVHRHIGSIEPWVKLREGLASSTDSLTVNFGSRTPLTIWNQFRGRKPLLLILLSVVCIFDFGLTIASSGMFEPSVDKWTEPVTDVISTLYNTSAFSDPQIRSEFGGVNLISDAVRTGKAFLSWNFSNITFYPLGIDDPDAEYMDMSIYTARTRGVGVELQCGKASYSRSSSNSSFWTYDTSAGTIQSSCTAQLPWPVPHSTASTSYNGSLYFSTALNTSRACQASFVVGHGGVNNTEVIHGTAGFSNVFSCSPKINIEDFKVTFDLDGIISRCEPIRGTSITSGKMFQNASNSLMSFNDAFMRHAGADTSWNAFLISQIYNTLNSNATLRRFSWPNSNHRRPSHKHSNILLKGESDKEDLLMRSLQLAYQAAFSSYISLHRDLYMPFAASSGNSNMSIPATVTSAAWYIEPSNTTIVVIIVLLSVDLSVLMAVFWLRHNYYSGPPFPRSIGGLIPWIFRSRMLSDVQNTNSWSENERSDHLQKLGHRYIFGEFGTSDTTRVALDYDEKPLLEEDYELESYNAPVQPPPGETSVHSDSDGRPRDSGPPCT